MAAFNPISSSPLVSCYRNRFDVNGHRYQLKMVVSGESVSTESDELFVRLNQLAQYIISEEHPVFTAERHSINTKSDLTDFNGSSLEFAIFELLNPDPVKNDTYYIKFKKLECEDEKSLLPKDLSELSFSDLLQKFELTEEEFENSRLHLQGQAASVTKNAYFKKDKLNGLPRSAVIIVSGKHPGNYLLLKHTYNIKKNFFVRGYTKAHNGVAKWIPAMPAIRNPKLQASQAGKGGYNNVTLALNLETKEIVAWRSGREEDEKGAEAVHELLQGDDRFLTGDLVKYRGKWTSRKKRNVTGIIADKCGMIMKYRPRCEIKDAPFEKKIKFTYKLAEIIRDFHDVYNYVHYDIKLGNIHQAPNGMPLLGDFGLARPKSEAAAQRGTPNHMAPELKSDFYYPNRPSPIPEKCDVWSFGVTLSHVFGYGNRLRPLFEGEDGLGTTIPLTKERTTALLKRELKKADPILKELLTMCFDPDPAQRPTMAGVVERLKKLRSLYPDK